MIPGVNNPNLRSMRNGIQFLNSITDVQPDMAGQVAVSGSHGGLYPASLASRAGLSGIVFNDAGGGLENAGAEGIFALEPYGVAALCADCMSCLIGSADDTYENGIVSQANEIAIALGIWPGMPISRALELIEPHPMTGGQMEKHPEARFSVDLDDNGPGVLAVDSASLVKPDDAGSIIVTGSHGGLIGGDPARALKARAKLGVFNDAGFGKNRIGISRLPALEERGIAAVTVSHATSRIGDAKSALASGLISACNAAGSNLGAREGDRLDHFLMTHLGV